MGQRCATKLVSFVSFFKRYRILSGGLLLAVLCFGVIYFSPLPEQLSNTQYSTVLYSKEGVLLGAQIAEDEQWRFPPVEKLPEKYIKALLTFEDKRFYQHPGVDPFAIARAIYSNFKKGHVVSGGSTITMQLARIIKGNRARTYWQKFKELLLAFQLEAHFTKDELLILYAAYAPYGGNTVGLASANWRYFGHNVSRMTWAEAALFSVLPNNPSSIYPGRNRDKLLSKRNKLLARLFQQGELSALDLKLAKLEPLPGSTKPLPNKARHLMATLKAKYPEEHQFNSTIDSQLQLQAYDITTHHSDRLSKTNINNLSVLVIDNFEKKVLAYVGNQTYQNKVLYSPALDIIQRPRSSGSLFKPFLFAMMLQQGLLLPETLVMDVPTYYNGYSPENYDRAYRGVVTAKQALIESLNVPSVRLLKEYGIGMFKQDLQSFGLTTLFRPADDYGLSLIIGGAETSLWDISNAYSGLSLAAFGRADEFHQATLLQEEKPTQTDFPIKQGAAWLTMEALSQLKRPGVATAWQEFSSSQQISWKTGTSYGWHDAWAVGSNGRYTVGVWAGNANGEEGRNLTGSKAAAPVMLDIFRLLADQAWPEKPFHVLQSFSVCKDDGYLIAADCELHESYAPDEASFSKVSPFHQRIYLDPQTHKRVHGACHAVSKMKTKSYFVLPPVAAFYYQKINPNHESVPEWRDDCLENLPIVANDLPMQLEYPAEGARIKIPVELDGKLGRTIFKAQHRLADARLYWHLNDEYLGETRHIHEKSVVVNAGWHRLLLVDQQGYQLERWFKVL